MDKQGAAARPATFFDMLRSWFLCGWIADKAALLKRRGGSYVGVGSNSSSSLNAQLSGGGGGVGGGAGKPYVRPSRWTQLVRKCRARLRRGGGGAGCWAQDHNPQQENQHYYKMDSYERNFDRGREFWEDLALIGRPLEDNSSGRWKTDASLPDPVWMISASQEEIKEKAAALAARPGGKV